MYHVKELQFLHRHAFTSCLFLHTLLHDSQSTQPHVDAICTRLSIHFCVFEWSRQSLHLLHMAWSQPNLLCFCVTSSQSTPRFLLQAHTHCTYKHCNHITFLQDAMLALTQNGPFHIDRSKCSWCSVCTAHYVGFFTDPTHNSSRNDSVFPVL